VIIGGGPQVKLVTNSSLAAAVGSKSEGGVALLKDVVYKCVLDVDYRFFYAF